MVQMTHSKPIVKKTLTQGWLKGFEQYRPETLLSSHTEILVEPEVKKQPQGPDLPGFDRMMAQSPRRIATSNITLPMLPYRGQHR